jgi:hypothetical protein
MNEMPFSPDRPVTPAATQNVDPALLQQMLIALTNLQLQTQNNRSAPLPLDPKIPDVQTFNGNKNHYTVFVAKLQNFFALQPNTYSSDQKKIGYVISRLEGAAADWAVTILGNPDRGNNFDILNDWNTFIGSFRKFSDPFSARNATDALLSLRQGKSQSVLAYWTRFEDLLYRSDISPDSARPLFERGLKYEIQDRLVDKNLPNDLDGYVMAVIDLDNRIYRLRQDRKQMTNWTSRQSNSHSLVVNPRYDNSPVPMDVGNVAMDSESFPENAVIAGVNLSNTKERLDQIRAMDQASRRQLCFEEHRCHYCKRVVGSPPVHLAQTGPFKLNKTKNEYFGTLPEVQPRKGTLHSEIEGVPLREELYLNIVKDRKTNLFFVGVHLNSSDKQVAVNAMVDSGAMGTGFIDGAYVEREGFVTQALEQPIKVRSVDGTPCGSGIITHRVLLPLQMEGFSDIVEFLVIKCPHTPLILGLEWLKSFNPVVNWKTGKLTFRKVAFKPESGKKDSLVYGDSVTIGIVGGDEVDSTTKGIFSEYADVFSQTDFPLLPEHRAGVDLSIDLIEGKSAPFGPIYSLSLQEEKVLKEYIEGALAAGIIRESRSAAGAPVMFVKKSDGGLRLCVDYRGLNSVTKTNRTALPIIRDLLFRANGSKYFSKIDLKSAFNLVRIVEGQEHLTAFRTKYGHFEYLVMPFGLKNAPGTFQGLMNSILGDLIDRGVLVYIDDILVYTEDLEGHLSLLQEVFERLRKNSLKANPKKCLLFQSQVDFLGHRISVDGVRMDVGKVETIKDWKIPGNVKELQSFLGLCNYYRDFIPGFASMAGPLYNLIKKGADYSWSPESQKAFVELKSAFLTDQLLIQPDSSKQFYLECDASDYALGAVLSQLDEKGVLRPVGFTPGSSRPPKLTTRYMIKSY